MVTLAFGQMVFFVFHDTKLGGGTDGAFLVRPTLSLLRAGAAAQPAPAADGHLLRGARPAGRHVSRLVLLLRSLFGRVLEGIRVNEHRMQALGFNTYRYKLAAFVIAGLLAGVAGHMWAMHRGFVNPELIGWHRSAEALLMILIGGLGTLHGPIVGALAFTGLSELPQLMEEWKPFAVIFNAIGLPKSGLLQPSPSASCCSKASSSCWSCCCCRRA